MYYLFLGGYLSELLDEQIREPSDQSSPEYAVTTAEDDSYFYQSVMSSIANMFFFVFNGLAMGVTLWLSLASLCSIVTAGRIDPVLGLVGSFGLFYTCVIRKFWYLQNKGTFFWNYAPKLWT